MLMRPRKRQRIIQVLHIGTNVFNDVQGQARFQRELKKLYEEISSRVTDS